ncbi:MAG: PAS domain S-box protein [Bacteroidetes bacterium]|nr:PAS domain S-box protein [Bacteroidota bacterium]
MGTDIRTLVIILGITHAIQILVFFHQYRISKSYKGVLWWLLWSASETIGFGVMLLRDIPSILPIVIIVQNTMIVLGTLFLFIGIRRFFGKNQNLKLVIPVGALFLSSLLYFLFIDNDIQVRSGIFSATIAIISFVTAFTLFKNNIKAITASVHFNALVFLVHGGIFAYRTIILINGAPIVNHFTLTMFNMVPYLDALIVSLLWTFGLIIMINHRLNDEIGTTKDELELIFDATPDAVILSNLENGIIVDVNEGFSTLIGYMRNEVIGKSTLKINIWKNISDREKVIELISQQGTCYNYEAVFVHKDGRLLVGLISAKKILLKGIPHLLSVTRDITKRQETEDEVRRIGKYYQTLIEKAPDGFVLLNEKGEFKFASPSARKMFGFEEKDIQNSNPADLTHPDDLPEVFKALTGIMEDPSYIPVVQYRFSDKEGSWRWVESTFSNLLGDENVESILINFRDITERKLAEEEVTSIGLHNKALIENAPDGIVLLDAEMHFTYASPAAAKIFGYDPVGDLNVNPNNITHSEDLPMVFSHLSKVIEDPSYVPTIRYRLADKQGNWKWLESTFRNLFADPHVGSLVINFRDITKQKRLEDVNLARLRLLTYAEEHSNDELFEETLNVAEELTESLIGFFHLVAEDQKTLTLQEWSTRTKREMCRAEGKNTTHHIDHAGVWADCLRESRPVIHNDYLSLPHRKGLPEGHAEIIREMAVPIIRNGKAKAILGVGNKPKEYTEEDVNLIGILSDFVYDIYERKRAEVAMKKSQDQLSSIFDTVGDVIMLLSVEPGETYRFISVNNSFLAATGLQFEQVIGKSVDEVIPEPSLTLVKAKYRQSILEKKTVRWEEATQYPKGLATGAVSITPVFDQNGECANLVGSVHDLTERIKMEFELKESEEKFRSITEQTSDFIAIADKEGRIVYASARAKQLFDCEPDEMCGRPFIEYADEKDVQAAAAAFQQILESGVNTRNLEFAMKRKDGSVFTGELSGSPFRTNSYSGALVVIRDVTERKKTEDALAESEKRYHRITDLMTDYVYEGWYFADGSVRTDWIGGAFEQITGYTTEEIKSLPKGFLNIVWEEDLGIVTNVAPGILDLQPREMEYRITCKNGDIRWLRDFTVPVNNEFMAGRVRLVGAVQDITARKLAEERLQVSERKYRRLVENAPTGVYTTTVDGKHIFANDAMCKILEYDSVEEFINVDVIATYHDKNARAKFVKELKKSKRIFNYDLVLITKNGRHVDVLINAFISGDQITGMIMDITDYKKVLAELSASEEKYRLLVENSGMGVGVYSLDGEILYFNQKAIENLGGKVEDYVGKKLQDIFGEPTALTYLSRFRETLSSENGKEYEDLVRFHDQEYWFLSNHSILRNPDGNILGVQVLAHDISIRKKAEEELNKKMDELQRFHNLTIGREHKMIELKKEINQLLEKSGQKVKYKVFE